MPTLTDLSPNQLQELVKAKLTELQKGDPLFKHMPIVYKNTDLVKWEQWDGYKPKEYNCQLEPGIYGDMSVFGLAGLVKRGGRDKVITNAINQMVSRMLARIKQVGWTLLTDATYSKLDRFGRIHHIDTFKSNRYVANTVWSDLANSNPIDDLGQVQKLGTTNGLTFGRTAKIYVNQTTFDHLICSEFIRHRLLDDGTNKGIIGLNHLNEVFSNWDLPEVVVHDHGYMNDSDIFIQYIPDGKVVVLASITDGTTAAEYQIVNNKLVQGWDKAMPYVSTQDKEVKRVDEEGNTITVQELEIHCGHNGGPALLCPQSVVLMSV